MQHIIKKTQATPLFSAPPTFFIQYLARRDGRFINPAFPAGGAPRWRVNLKGGGALNVNPPSPVDLFKCHRSLFCSG